MSRFPYRSGRVSRPTLRDILMYGDDTRRSIYLQVRLCNSRSLAYLLHRCQPSIFLVPSSDLKTSTINTMLGLSIAEATGLCLTGAWDRHLPMIMTTSMTRKKTRDKSHLEDLRSTACNHPHTLIGSNFKAGFPCPSLQRYFPLQPSHLTTRMG
jgi:hypothetical protein